MDDSVRTGFTWAEVGVIGSMGVFLAIVTTANALNAPYTPPLTSLTQEWALRLGSRRIFDVVLWTLFAVPILWACVRAHPQRIGWPKAVGTHLLLAVATAVAAELGQRLVHAGVVALWPPAEHKPIPLRPSTILANVQFVGGLVPYLMLMGIGFGRYEYMRSQAQEARAQRLRTELVAARLQSLRMQINPHFFHNTLHTISTMAGHDPDGVRRATTRLSDLMRYALSTSDQHEVPLEKELRVLQSYLDIQKIRLEEQLTVTFDVDPDVRRALVPTLLLQPLAENAVKHGFEGRDEPGHLRIRASRDDEVLILSVEDDGCGLSDQNIEEVQARSLAEMQTASSSLFPDDSVGLANIAARLDGLYGEAAALDFGRSPDAGLRVTVRLPLRWDDADGDLRAPGVAVTQDAAA